MMAQTGLTGLFHIGALLLHEEYQFPHAATMTH
jgi:hypothetical protein